MAVCRLEAETFYTILICSFGWLVASFDSWSKFGGNRYLVDSFYSKCFFMFLSPPTHNTGVASKLSCDMNVLHIMANWWEISIWGKLKGSGGTLADRICQREYRTHKDVGRSRRASKFGKAVFVPPPMECNERMIEYTDQPTKQPINLIRHFVFDNLIQAWRYKRCCLLGDGLLWLKGWQKMAPYVSSWGIPECIHSFYQKDLVLLTCTL